MILRGCLIYVEMIFHAVRYFYLMPVFTQESGVLFCEKNCANGSIQTALMKAGIETRPYEEVEQYIRKMGQGKRVAMDMRVVNAHLAAQVPNENTLVDVVNQPECGRRSRMKRK